jgi:quinohemoprotein ethanol dehydrogenase
MRGQRADLKQPIRLAATALVIAVGAASGCARPATVVDDAALTDERAGDNWLAYGRTHREQRHSPLTRISDTSIGRLGVAWYLDLPKDRSLVSTPLVVDGTMFFVGSYNVVRAVDAASGAPRWEYDPRVLDHVGQRARIMWDISRGLAYWRGKVYVGTLDGRLIGLDAGTGRELWSTLTVDTTMASWITGAPRAMMGMVLIGNGITEVGAMRGYVTAYDAETGAQVWRFHTVPGNPADGFENDAMEMAAKTWTGAWWRFGGGGTVWNSITYDPEFDAVYIGTGNGAPWNRKIRSPGGGDNLFLSSIVALDVSTGAYRWHYQTTPGESWDYNSNMDIVLADLPIEGRTVKALLHAPKNGFFYVIDRENGRLLSAKPFAETTWASRVDLATGRPVENPGARYEDGEELVKPGPTGAHNWHPMSFNPATGLVYIPAQDRAVLYSDRGVDLARWEPPHLRFDPGVTVLTADPPAEGATSSLKAWDPVAQRLAWEKPLPGFWNAGTLTTAGNLVFQGRADGKLVAYRADSGEEVWSFDLGLGISAPPITYAVDGTQYLAILVGWGGAPTALGGSVTAQHGWAYRVHTRRLVVFRLGGDVSLPSQPAPFRVTPLASPEFPVDPALAARGGQLYRSSNCVMCHGPGVVSGGAAPDLRASPVVLSETGFADVVSGGARQSLGMPRFPELSAEDREALRHYIRSRARL